MQTRNNRLAEFILANSEPILAQWESITQTTLPSVKNPPVLELRGQMEQMLGTIVTHLQPAILAHSLSPNLTPAEITERYAAKRLMSGFTIEQLIAEFHLLRSCIFGLCSQQPGSLNGIGLDELICLNEAIDQALSDSVAHYTRVEGRARSLFLGMLGHDLRTPLGAISMTVQGLPYLLNSSPGQLNKFASRINSCVQRANQIVGNVLDLTRVHVGSGIPLAPADVELSEICLEVIEELKLTHAQRELVFESSGKCQGSFDRGRIAQVFCNLIENALQHGEEAAPVKVRLAREGDAFVLTVWNSCSPIPPEELERIFDPLRRYAARTISESSPMNSLGLGLYISREIVRAHGGTISVESTARGGTSFTVRLPCRRSPME